MHFQKRGFQNYVRVIYRNACQLMDCFACAMCPSNHTSQSRDGLSGPQKIIGILRLNSRLSPMPAARYKFIRDTNSPSGLFSENTASTDAVRALTEWKSEASGRACEWRLDERGTLIAEVIWQDSDSSAVDDLYNACRAVGVSTIHQS